MSRYAAALFDLDGTLVDSSAGIVAAVRHAFTVVGALELPDSEDILMEIGKPLEEIHRDLGAPGGPEKASEFAHAFREFYARHFADGVRLYPGVLEGLQDIASAGVAAGVVTTKLEEQADMVVAAVGLRPFVRVVRGWKEGRQHKPSPEPVLEVTEALGVVPHEALMVGDSELDILAGRAAGTATCGVTYGFRPAAYLASFQPDYMIARFSDLIPIVCGW
ncbi:MAG: HAD-IA family hydrolase [candidate division WOR-3 bacterium]